MIYDYGNALTEERADDAHLVACAVWDCCEAVVGDVFDAEVSFVVYHADVYAASVGRIVMDYTEVEAAEFGLGDDVFHHRAVLDFRHAYDGRAEGRCLGLELRNGISEVMQFFVVLACIPLARTAGSELNVAAFGVVGNRVEEVFEVIEGNTGNLNLAVVVGSAKRQNC